MQWEVHLHCLIVCLEVVFFFFLNLNGGYVDFREEGPVEYQWQPPTLAQIGIELHPPGIAEPPNQGLMWF